MSFEDLAAVLRNEGIVFPSARLRSLSTTFPDLFETHDNGSLSARLAGVEDGGSAEDDQSLQDTDGVGEWWAEPTAVNRIDLSDVVVVDIETTGLDAQQDAIWELGAVNLGSGEHWSARVQVEPESEAGTPPLGLGEVASPLGDALGALAAFVGNRVMAGHNVADFDVPFLKAQAARAGLCWEPPARVLDSLPLSILSRPELPTHGLGDLCREFQVPLLGAHRALADAVATAEVIRRILAEVDPRDPSWALAAGCLARAGSLWPALMPDFAPLEAIADGLIPADDPLALPDQTGVPIRSLPQAFEALRRADQNIETRSGQREMAEAVAETFDLGGRLAVEAPTGTGKSIAYLLPAAIRAASGPHPVVLATATRVLQRQLRQDALRLRSLGALGVPFRQIQGVSNYICTREVANELQGVGQETSQWLALAVAVRALRATGTGLWSDVADGSLFLRDAGYRQMRAALSTDSASCEGRQCEWVDKCPLYVRLRGLESAAGILSVNHAVVGSWAKIESEGGRIPGRLLDDARSDFVFDEAHNLEDTLTDAWSDRVDELDLRILSRRIEGRDGPLRLSSELERVTGTPLVDLTGLRTATHQFKAAAVSLAGAARTYFHEFAGEQRTLALAAGVVQGRPEFRSLSAAAFETLSALDRVGKALHQVHNETASRVAGLASETRAAKLGRTIRVRIQGLAADIRRLGDTLQSLRSLGEEHRYVHLLEVPSGYDGQAAEPWSYRRVPIHIGDTFTNLLVRPAHSVTLTSATLTVGGGFDFLGRRLGIAIHPGKAEADDFEGRQVQGPFDYTAQSAVVLTNHLPLPIPSAEDEFCQDLAADQIGFQSLTGGKSLVLFAARSRMEKVAGLMRQRSADLERRGVHLLVQHEQSASEIAHRFRTEPGTVAFGLRSYWQGFDAPGDTLSYLVIEKPPYPHPGDAIVSARQRAVAEAGGDPFLDYVVPKTAILMAQGFGRLIRTRQDRGVAIICDRRLQLPTQANQMLLSALPGPSLLFADNRDDAWTKAIAFVTGTPPDLSTALTSGLDDNSARLAALRLLPGEDPEPKLTAAARLLFGIDRLRPAQLKLMLAILEGHDVLGLLPTGYGKSLCFQLPALLGPSQAPTIVVSPLIALIKDQVDDLRARRGLRPVQGITGATTSAERTEILRDVSEGKIRLLYVSPERLVRDPTLRKALETQHLAALVVDEAHCLSFWGHDFRPEFRQLAKAVVGFERAPRVGLTATATPEVEDDIAAPLNLDRPVVVREPVDRANLRFSVVQFASDRERARELLRVVTHFGAAPGIVYASRRTTTEELASLLRRAGIRARHYHAGMVPEQRDAVQEDFSSGSSQVICATKAFGLGINKPDIRWVLHYDLPESLESYAQEAGRAARDADLQGDCILFFTRADIARRQGQLAGPATPRDLALARRVFAAVTGARKRGSSVHFDPEEMSQTIGMEEDDLNVALAWLERAGALVRLPDCSERGAVTIGFREPTDPTEARTFRELFKVRLRVTVGARRYVDFEELENEYGIDADALEDLLVKWSLERLVTFSSTRRHWRIEIAGREPDERRYLDTLGAWRALERRRLQSMIDYARGGQCRRSQIADHFGDPLVHCADRAALVACDRCSGAPPVWRAVPIERVPDPEALVDCNLAVLQAVAWASAWGKGSYGERGLEAALLGKESLGPNRPLGRGLLNCPQFGSLRHVRGGERRFRQAVEVLMGAGLLARNEVGWQDHTYSSLAITPAGSRYLGGSLV